MNFEDETLIRMSAAKNYNLWILSKIKPFIGKKILEVGCGIGPFFILGLVIIILLLIIHNFYSMVRFLILSP